MTRIVYKLLDACEQVSLSRDYLLKAIHSTGEPGQIPHLRARKAREGGRDFLITHADLEAWAASLPDA